MQRQPAKQMQQALPQTNGTQAKLAPQPWVKPTFERVPLNEALATFGGTGTDQSSYAS
jgi:hypothetical protein